MTKEISNWFKVGDFKIGIARFVEESRFGLSVRERECMAYLSMGYNVTRISDVMGVSRNTVNTFKARLFSKLGISTAAEAATILTAVVCGGTIERDGSGQSYRSVEVSQPGILKGNVPYSCRGTDTAISQPHPAAA